MLNSLIIKARFKLILIASLLVLFIYTTTGLFRSNIIYQIIIFTLVTIYYFFTSREALRTFLNFAKFLLVIIALLHSIIFIYKAISLGLVFAKDFYINKGPSIIVRIFIIPNIFAFVNILISKINFKDIIMLSKNNNKPKIIYILMISGIEVMERLRIYYEYHPLNLTNKGVKKILHYLAVPLTLFFGIYRGFEYKYNALKSRESILKE